MLEAPRLTRAGQLTEATALLQRVLRGKTARDTTSDSIWEALMRLPDGYRIRSSRRQMNDAADERGRYRQDGERVEGAPIEMAGAHVAHRPDRRHQHVERQRRNAHAVRCHADQ